MLQGRIYLILFLGLALQACNAPKLKKIYTSDCATDIKFKKVSFRNLVDSIKHYNGQYVEVSGRYMEGKNVSALVNDSTFTDHSNSHSLWVNFTQECPLYLGGNGKGLFETDYGNYNNRQVTIRGRVDAHMNKHAQTYRATINEISYLELD